jgi:hypothetical protein
LLRSVRYYVRNIALFYRFAVIEGPLTALVSGLSRARPMARKEVTVQNAKLLPMWPDLLSHQVDG